MTGYRGGVGGSHYIAALLASRDLGAVSLVFVSGSLAELWHSVTVFRDT